METLAYETYIQAFEKVAHKHLGYIEGRGPTADLGGVVVGDHGSSRG